MNTRPNPLFMAIRAGPVELMDVHGRLRTWSSSDRTSVMRAALALERLHGAVPSPHWYLNAIGTRPARQGEGLGAALVAAGTSQADGDGLPCYLETANPRNVEFFGRRGFEVTGSEHVHGYPIFGLVREPR